MVRGLCASVQLSHLLRVEGIVRQVDLRKARHGKAREDGRLRADGVEVVVEEEQLLFPQLDRALLHGGAQEQLVGSEHLAAGATSTQDFLGRALLHAATESSRSVNSVIQPHGSSLSRFEDPVCPCVG